MEKTALSPNVSNNNRTNLYNKTAQKSTKR
jgi:hypothetical protein